MLNAAKRCNNKKGAGRGAGAIWDPRQHGVCRFERHPLHAEVTHISGGGAGCGERVSGGLGKYVKWGLGKWDQCPPMKRE